MGMVAPLTKDAWSEQSRRLELFDKVVNPLAMTRGGAADVSP